MGYSMKRGLMMRPGYDKNYPSPFTQTPPDEDPRSGEWKIEKGQERVGSIEKKGKQTTVTYETPISGKKENFPLAKPGTPEYEKWSKTTPEQRKKFLESRSGSETRKEIFTDLKVGPVTGTMKPSTDLMKKSDKPKFQKPTMQGTIVGSGRIGVKLGLDLGADTRKKQKSTPKYGCPGGC